MITIYASTIKRYPVKFCILGLCILLLLGFELRQYFDPLPAQQWNMNNLKKIHVFDPENFSFAAFGYNKNSKEVFENLLKLIDHDPEIAFAVSLGDMVQSGNKQRYRWFLKQVKANLSIALLTLIGNNELKGEGVGLYHDIFGPRYYAFGIGSSYFIVLDNAAGKELDSEQERWFIKELEKSRDWRSRIVFMHVPLYDPRGGDHYHWLAKGYSQRFMKLIKRYQVTHLFSSYIHGYYAGQWKGVPYTVTGGAGAELNGGDPAHDTFHYLKVNVRNGTVHVEERQIPCPPFEHMGPTGYTAWLYLSSFLRFHGVESFLLLIVGGLLMVFFRDESRKTRISGASSSF